MIDESEIDACMNVYGGDVSNDGVTIDKFIEMFVFSHLFDIFAGCCQSKHRVPDRSCTALLYHYCKMKRRYKSHAHRPNILSLCRILQVSIAYCSYICSCSVLHNGCRYTSAFHTV